MCPAVSSHSISPFQRLAMLAQSGDESAAVAGLPVKIVSLARREFIVRQGDKTTRCFSLVDGFCCSFKVTSRGDRQIVALHLPGDMPDLLSLHLTTLDFSISTLSPCTVSFVPHLPLRSLCDHYPRLANLLWRETLVEGAISREFIVNNGQRSSLARVSHIYCEVFTRLGAAGLHTDRYAGFP